MPIEALVDIVVGQLSLFLLTNDDFGQR